MKTAEKKSTTKPARSAKRAPSKSTTATSAKRPAVKRIQEAVKQAAAKRAARGHKHPYRELILKALTDTKAPLCYQCIAKHNKLDSRTGGWGAAMNVLLAEKEVHRSKTVCGGCNGIRSASALPGVALPKPKTAEKKAVRSTKPARKK